MEGDNPFDRPYEWSLGAGSTGTLSQVTVSDGHLGGTTQVMQMDLTFTGCWAESRAYGRVTEEEFAGLPQSGTLDISFWYRITAESDLGLMTGRSMIYFGDYEARWISPELEATTWTECTGQVTVGAMENMYETEINFSVYSRYGNPNTITIQFDDLQVTPEPASLALLGLGGIAALIRRRR